MVCEKVAKMTQMRHNNLANALRLVVSAGSCQSAAEPRYRALAGKKGMVECQRRGDIVAVLPRLELAAVDVVVAHASAKSYAAEAAKIAGGTAARTERTNRTRFRKDVPDHAAFRFVPFAVETCGYMGKEAVKFVNRLEDIAAESGRIPKGAFVRWAMQQCRDCLCMQLLTVTPAVHLSIPPVHRHRQQLHCPSHKCTLGNAATLSCDVPKAVRITRVDYERVTRRKQHRPGIARLWTCSSAMGDCAGCLTARTPNWFTIADIELNIIC